MRFLAITDSHSSQTIDAGAGVPKNLAKICIHVPEGVRNTMSENYKVSWVIHIIMV